MVEALGLDNARMSEVAATGAPGEALGEDGARFGHGASFYSLLVRDPKSGTVVTLPHAYDPARVEDVIPYLGGGKAKPRPVKPDVLRYAREHGPVPPRRGPEGLRASRGQGEGGLGKGGEGRRPGKGDPPGPAPDAFLEGGLSCPVGRFGSTFAASCRKAHPKPV